jgi:hypothetical protein
MPGILSDQLGGGSRECPWVLSPTLCLLNFLLYQKFENYYSHIPLQSGFQTGSASGKDEGEIIFMLLKVAPEVVLATRMVDN